MCAVRSSELEYGIEYAVKSIQQTESDHLLLQCAGLAGVTENGQYGAGLCRKFTAAMFCQFI